MVHYMGEGKNEKIGELKQSKCRNRKVFITDVAVDKVPLIQYKGLTGRQNRIMRKLAQAVKLFQMCARNLNKTSGREEIYQAALMFLEGCNKMGIYYC